MATGPSEEEHQMLAAICRRLYARRGSGLVIPFVEKKGANWEPQQWLCHGNAIRWVTENPDWKAIPGWLIFDLSFAGRWRFSAHSVVEDADGTRIDITPAPTASRRYPFLEDEASHGDFMRLIGSARVQELDYELATGVVIVRTV